MTAQAVLPSAETPQLESALEVEALGFDYGAQPVFDAVSLRVAPREIVCLLGGSGCGKSTLLRVLSGLDRPRRGHVRFAGEPLLEPDPRAALLFQTPSLLPWLDVEGNVGFGLDFKRQARRRDASGRSSRVARAIRAVGLQGRQRAFPAQLSGGMAQRVALARALAREPLLLLADEPFAALDAITRAEMQELLLEIVQRWNTAVVLVTHDIDECVLLADRVLLMGGAPSRGTTLVGEWSVDIPRPRSLQPERASALRFELLGALRDARPVHPLQPSHETPV